MIKIGLIARADLSRGLGIQTYGFFTHLDPTKVLVIDMGERAVYPQSFTAYTTTPTREVRVSKWAMDGSLPDTDIQWFLDGIDVIFTAETFYDPRIIHQAYRKHIPTIVQPNWEFSYWNITSELKPTLFAWPSRWMQDNWPDNSIYLPFPIDSSVPSHVRTQATHYLHIAGHPTRADRDGTKIINELIPYIRDPAITFTITSQHHETSKPYSRNFNLNLVRENVPDLTPFYTAADILVLPRRFGGQSLKLNEAMATGCIPLMPDCPPQSYFLPTECLVSPIKDHSLRTQGGNVTMYRVSPRHIASRLLTLTRTPNDVEKLSKWVLDYVKTMDWPALLPLYHQMFKDVLK